MQAKGRTPRGVLDVWQTKGLRESEFGCVAMTGVTGEFLGSVARKGDRAENVRVRWGQAGERRVLRGWR